MPLVYEPHDQNKGDVATIIKPGIGKAQLDPVYIGKPMQRPGLFQYDRVLAACVWYREESRHQISGLNYKYKPKSNPGLGQTWF